MKRPHLAVVVVAGSLLIPVLAPPAQAGRRVDAAKRAEQLLRDLAAAQGDSADRVEQEIAELATDVTYMDEVEPVLIQTLDSRNGAQRRAAARLLRYTVSGAAVTPLAGVLARDASEEVRLEAATSLCLLKGDAAAGTLRNTRQNDASGRVRAAASAALDVIEDPSGAGSRGCRSAIQNRLAALR